MDKLENMKEGCRSSRLKLKKKFNKQSKEQSKISEFQTEALLQ